MMSDPDRIAIHIETLGGLCPVQAEGTIDGVPFYFRARGDAWRIEIGEGNTGRVVDAMAGGPTPESERLKALPPWEYGEPYGEWPDAGYMSEDEARAFIAQGAQRWREAMRAVRGDAGRQA